MGTSMSTTKEGNVIWEGNVSTELRTNYVTNGESGVCDTTFVTNVSNESGHSPDITETKVSGIYKIVNKVDGKYYVGSSDHIKRRWYSHRTELRKNRHGNQYLQRAWNKYGEINFEFIIVERASPDKCLIIEQRYLDNCKNDRSISYNIGYDAIAFMSGRHHTEESKRKIGDGNRGKIHPLSARQKQSTIMKGKYDGDKNPNYGRKHTPEEKAKMLLGRTDKTIYAFENILTSESFSGTRMEFGETFGIDKYNIFNIVHHRSNNCQGWVIYQEHAYCPSHTQ